MTARLLAVVGAVAFVLAACAGGSSGPVGATSPTPRLTPTPVSTLVATGASCRRALGGTVSFADAGHSFALRVTTARPRVVDHALAAYAHAPANGHFLIVDVIVKNLTDTGIRLDPTRFVFTTTGGRRLTVDSGNAPYSGASHVLDPTFLVAQASEHGPLIYDTPQTHGRIVFTPSGKTACTWTL
jgi:hypothetical protein